MDFNYLNLWALGLNPLSLRELAVKDLPLDRTATLVPAFAVKDLPLGRTLMMMMMMIHDYDNYLRSSINRI